MLMKLWILTEMMKMPTSELIYLASPYSHENPRIRGQRFNDVCKAAAGVNVCLGTDSLASCPSLSVLDEARFLFAQGGAEPQLLLAMATRRGARALGLEDVTGDLREGLVAGGLRLRQLRVRALHAGQPRSHGAGHALPARALS